MAAIFEKFDNDKTAFLNPQDTTKKDPHFPNVCITTYSENIIRKMSESEGVKETARLYTANGITPVYETSYGGKRIAFYLSKVGAPACVAGLEEIIALGAQKLVVFGCCGILDKSAGNKIIVPSAAVRDEGTSYHYVKAAEEIEAQPDAVSILVRCLEKCGLDYVIGKTWTTDAIYRETRGLIKERKKQGCLCVEMECAANFAAAQFRNVPLIQFLYGADHLDCETWEPGNLTEYGITDCGIYAALAFECAVCM